jgi:hypothetical protein
MSGPTLSLSRPGAFDDRGRLHYAVVIVVNGRPVVWSQDKDELIENGGEVMITRFHCGG